MNPGSIRLILLLALGLNSGLIWGQYISEIIEYKPAPGQYINEAGTGTPYASESIRDSINGMVNLGAFGGYIVFGFEEAVENHIDNPFGIDFTIFGNAQPDWSEPGIVSVMKDDNNNGLPDDTWYELAGSDYYFSSTVKGYEVNYTNPHENSAADVYWQDNKGKTGYIYANTYHSQPYYPMADSFPDINNNRYSLSGTMIKDTVDNSQVSSIKSYTRAFGYADNMPKGEGPVNIPDNPYTPEIENSGGDAFDINWAVDKEGNYVNLDRIHFIKVHNAVLADAGPVGELSTEIRGAVDIEPDKSLSGILDMIVIKDLPPEIDSSDYQLEVFVFYKGRLVEESEINWTCSMPEASVSSDNILSVNKPGELTITASLADSQSVTASASTIIKVSQVSVRDNSHIPNISVYPNPASDYICIKGFDDAEIQIFDLNGSLIRRIDKYMPDSRIEISGLARGIYFIKGISTSGVFIKKMVRK